MIIITNNPLVRDYYSGINTIEMKFVDNIGYMDVLKESRNLIHMGMVLLTHPLSGSVKPNETPYKSIALADSALHEIDSLWLIENAIGTYIKFERNKRLPQWTERVKSDFMIIDFDLFKCPILNSKNACIRKLYIKMV